MSSGRTYYDEFWRGREGEAVERDPLTPLRIAMFAERFERGQRVLDAGCGSGGTTAALAASGYRVIGAELSAMAAAAAHGRAAAPVVQAKLEGALPFPAASFDAVFCTDVLEHVMDVQSAVREFERVLAPGGRVFASVPYHGLGKNVAIALFSFDRHFDPCGPHIRFFSPRTLAAVFEKAGLRVIETTHIGRAWPFHKNTVIVARKPA